MSVQLTPEQIRQFTPDEIKQLELMDTVLKWKAQRKLLSYKPYPKQLAFHAAGLSYRERLLRAANQSGKSLSAAAETAFHLTGLYTDDWPGKRFRMPTKGWTVSESWTFSRDNAQRLLLGEPGEWGTGYIPADSIVKINRAQHSAVDVVDTVSVRHSSGGLSKLMFKSAEVDRNKLGGDTIDFAWCDEELPSEHYEEVLTRTNVRQGPIYTTFTPLKGQTALVKRFLIDKVAGTHDIVMTIFDALHYTPEQREAIIASYPEHTRQARVYGIPTLGSGLVWSIPEDKIRVTPFDIPKHWPRIVGIDFGITHPFAMAWWAIDRDTDTAYLYRCYRTSGETPDQHYAPYREVGDWIPTAWPADALQTEKGTGVQIAARYRKVGFQMLREKAMLPRTGRKGETDRTRLSVEIQAIEQDAAMRSGNFKVFANCEQWFEEYRLYHRDERGVIVKKNDDTIRAAAYAWIMRAHARTKAEAERVVWLPPMSYSDRV